MKKYLLLLFDKEDAYKEMSPEDYQEEIEAHGRWIEELGEHFDSGEALEFPAKTVRGKEKTVTDGPFLEIKELVGGFYIINADSIEHASELAKGCPVFHLGGNIEVREIMAM